MASNLPAALAGTVPAALVDYDPDRMIRLRLKLSLIAIAVLVFGFGSAMAFIPIGGAVVGSGQVGVESRIKRVAHPTGGIISAIYVKNGDHVNKGDILMRLDDQVTGTQSTLSSLTVDQLMAQRARLEAERLGTGAIAFPAELRTRARTDAGARQAMADEEKLFRIRRTEQGGIGAQLAARVVQYRKQIDGFNAQIAALQKQQALIEPERASVRELWEKNLVTIGRLNQIERTSADMQGSIANLQSQIAQAQARITEANEQMLQMSETRRSDAGTQLSTVNGTLNQEQIRNVNAADLHERSVIRAPYSGTVDKIAFSTIGDVIRPAETIMEVVPDRDRLLVEAMVSPADIDQLRDGQRARIRFTAFSNTATPEISGKVIFVAPERTTDAEARQSYYAVRVEVDPRDLARWPELKLRPGMPAEIFIETGSRSMLSYLTKPLRDQFARAFRDN
ncbi:HlyD family type I secretion periplasmic adaptor subunit [Sphingomonas aracearum]|uniref:Membrane fusion protein (MFP) family protein n=1 Tax=Sphingomonas aracearum TaxID=2283317 RepID=A0A369VTX6_9SPHN|nr:HlyD family type I secretion periplasmic adaptor subunit [Sphingomonas aracearum]RDE05309.1 HlyD family type I secretion periplasmic adaptor subunit [Sphingomonas aracearum]